MQIDRTSPIPIAYQLETELRRQMSRGELRPGQMLPTEQELCRLFSISRTPVRRALGRLAADGLIVRTPGRGTEIAATATVATEPAPPAVEVVTATVLTHAWCWPLQQAAASIAAGQPGRQIRLQFNVVDLPRLMETLVQSIARGEAPDISIIDSVWVTDFARRGYVWAVDQIDPALATTYADDLLPPLRLANTWRGKLYGLPAEADVSVLWYRKDWLAAEGLTPPRTWDEWLACLLWFKSPAVRQRHGLAEFPLAFCGGGAAGETTTYQLLPLLWSAGADLIEDGEIVLNSGATVAAVQFAADLVREHGVAAEAVTAAHWNAPALALAAGSVAFALGGSYESSLIRAAAGWDEAEFRARVGMLPIPAGPGGRPAAIMGSVSYAIFRQSRQAGLALDLLMRATQPGIWRTFGSQRGVNPPTISANAALDPATNALAHDSAALHPYARERWPLEDYPRVSAQLAQMFEAAISGQLEATAAVERAAAVIAGITGLPERGARWLSRSAAG